MTKAYYNEIDPFAAQWLRNLISAGHIVPGDVDERSIIDVRAADLAGYDQCHFFAGIGGWSYALQLAEWDGHEVWTGSCPCQPFSSAGKQSGSADDRHLWPAWFRLIRECRPDTIIGEQVEGSVGFGLLDRVFADLEAEGYACGAAVLGAHSVGAPHIRQRLFWVADAGSERRQQISRSALGDEGADGRQPNGDHVAAGGSTTVGLGNAIGSRLEEWTGERRDDEPERSPAERAGGAIGGLADAEHAIGRPLGRSEQDVINRHDIGRAQAHGQPGACGEVRRVADATGARCIGAIGDTEGNPWDEARMLVSGEHGTDGRLGDADSERESPLCRVYERPRTERAGDSWHDAEWLSCLDGKARRTQSGIFPLVDGFSGSRVGVLRGTGNAIVPQAAAEFIRAFLEAKR